MGMARKHTSHGLPKASNNLQRSDIAPTKFSFLPATKTTSSYMDDGHTVYYVITRQDMMSLEDYVKFLKRTRWKTYNKKEGRQLFGNYLAVIV
jgi:hypothetical protein